MLELICEVGDCLKQSRMTVHLAAEYMDRYLWLRLCSDGITKANSDVEFANRIFEGHSLDALTISCLLLASKFNEIDDNIPLIEEFCKGHGIVRDSLDSGNLAGHATNRRPQLQGGLSRTYPSADEVESCEKYLLGMLEWDLNSVTPLHFVQSYLAQGAQLLSNDRFA